MKRLLSIFILVSLLGIQGIKAEDELTIIDKKYNFSVRQSQEYTFLYNKNVIITKWKNEGFSCDKEGGYGQNSDVMKARACISDELSLKNKGKNWYSFRILYKNYPEYYLYNTKSMILYRYGSFDKILQSSIGKNGLYYLFSIDASSPGNEELNNEFILQFKNDGTYEEIYRNVDPKARLVSYELLPQKKIKLLFQTNNIATTKIIIIK